MLKKKTAKALLPSRLLRAQQARSRRLASRQGRPTPQEAGGGSCLALGELASRPQEDLERVLGEVVGYDVILQLRNTWLAYHLK